MAQLVVRSVPDEVKERLKRRAKLHGRSLEAEVRDILANVPEPLQLPGKDKNWATALNERIRETGVTSEDIDDLNASIAELRGSWRVNDIAEDR